VVRKNLREANYTGLTSGGSKKVEAAPAPSKAKPRKGLKFCTVD